jgi:cell division transport system permease protein
MALSTRYVRRETFASLTRNRLMTIVGMLTVAVSLSLIGIAILLQVGVSNAASNWSNGVNVAVFLQPTATATETQAIHHELVTMPVVRHCTYMSKSQDYAEMRRLFAAEPSVYQEVPVTDVPPSYRCALHNPNEAALVNAALGHQPGVRNVEWPGQEVKTMEHVSSVVQLVFFALAAILFLSAFVLIANTIRLAIFSRRREISVMKLVGATNWFVRIPFMLEGFIQGLVGSLVALLALLGVHWWIDQEIHRQHANLLQSVQVSGGELVGIAILIVVLGVLMGMASSTLAIRRFLKEV